MIRQFRNTEDAEEFGRKYPYKLVIFMLLKKRQRLLRRKTKCMKVLTQAQLCREAYETATETMLGVSVYSEGLLS